MTERPPAPPAAPLRFDFSEALRFVKAGAAMRRAGWNGKGMWIGYCSGSRVSVHGGERAEYTEATTLPFLVTRTADGKYVPWLASMPDILAEDWEFANARVAELCAEGIPEPEGAYRFAGR